MEQSQDRFNSEGSSDDPKKSEVVDTSKKDFSFELLVGKSGRDYIENCFDVLILEKRIRPYEWYQDKDISLDKSDASKIRRGLIIPPLWLRLKIAKYFSVDSCMIWRIQDLDYIKKTLKKQKGNFENE